jgi:hypothetical protein
MDLSTGPEMTMGKRFSLTAMPMYVFPGTVKGTQFNIPINGKMESVGTPEQGKFGGFALLLKGAMTW